MKKIFNPASKTHLVATATMITGAAYANIGQLQAALEPSTLGWCIFGLGIVNQALRSITDKPVDQK